MTIRLSRRVFLGTSAAAALGTLAEPALATAAPDADRLLLVHDGARPWEDAASMLARSNPDRPALVVGERLLPAIGGFGEVALVSWGAFDRLLPERLADILNTNGPVRVASAAGGQPGPHQEAWANIGRLMALRPEFGRVLVDLTGGGRRPAPDVVAKGLVVLRGALGPDGASRLLVRSTGDPNRTG